MIRYIFILISFVLLCQLASAQKAITVYYMKSDGNVVLSRDSADFIINILPPDSIGDKKLFPVKVFSQNGKLLVWCNSLTNSHNLKLQGSYISFFANGLRKTIENMDNGKPVGDVISYYPNGRLYTVKNYMPLKPVYFKQCNDSTGKILSLNGTGKWLEFNGRFSKVDSAGSIVDSLKDGEWLTQVNDTVNLVSLYKKGEIISAKIHTKSGLEIDGNHVFDESDKLKEAPTFPGGLDAFGRFLGHTIRYPRKAMEHGIQGQVIISVIVERNGDLTNIKTEKSVDPSIDEESIRVIKLSPPWKPATIYGIPVRAKYSIPISFTLSNN